MFTGIIEAVGSVACLDKLANDFQITVATQMLDMSDVKLGDSIATNGVCLTVVAKTATSFTADVSAETVAKTNFSYYRVGQQLNLEKALTPNSRLGGHIVSGHVDAVGEIKTARSLGRAVEYWIQVPSEISHYIAIKGSITIDGISLTINDVDGHLFKITIVPHTAQQTTINNFTPGQLVNIEVDVLARYLERLMQPTDNRKSMIDMSFLAKHGFVK